MFLAEVAIHLSHLPENLSGSGYGRQKVEQPGMRLRPF
jgi:hypothetical protein